jgi:hypothetical protein
MLYSMAGRDAAPDMLEYMARNRTITIQELQLRPAQRLALLEFVQWNAREENRFYRYDYFRDNCSTRVRDALDRVLGGAIRRATSSVITERSYRDHALRLMAEDRLTATGIDIGLGRLSDRPITAWEEMFIPMLMRDRLRDVRVPDENGRLVPLVSSERVVFEARRAPEPYRPPNRAPLFLLASTVVGGIFLGLTPRRGGADGWPRGVARVLMTLWCFAVGLVGVLLVFLWTATEHVFAYDNLNLLQYNPAWLFLGMLLPFTGRPRPARWTMWCSAIGACLTAVAMVLACVPPLRQHSLGVLMLAAPANLAAAGMTRRLAGRDAAAEE